MKTFKIIETRRELWSHCLYVDAETEEEAREMWRAGEYEPDPEPDHESDMGGTIRSIQED